MDYEKKCAIAAAARKGLRSDELDAKYVDGAIYFDVVSRCLQLSEKDETKIAEFEGDFQLLKGFLSQLTIEERRLVLLIQNLIATYDSDHSEAHSHAAVTEAMACARETSDVELRCSCYALIIGALGKMGENSAAEVVFGEAVAFGRQHKEHSKWASGMASVGSAILAIASCEERWRFRSHSCFALAFNLGWDIKRQSGDTTLLDEVGEVMALNRMYNDAINIARATNNRRIIGKVVLELVNEERYEEAVKNRRVIPMYNQADLAYAFAMKGEWANAHTTAEQIEDYEWRRKAKWRIAQALIESDQFEEALDVIKNAGDSIEDPYTYIVSQLSIKGLLEAAQEFVNRIRDGYEKCLALCVLSDEYIKQGDLGSAIGLAESALSVAHALNDDETMAQGALKAAASQLARGGRTQKALEVALSIDEHSREYVVVDVVRYLATNDCVEDAQVIMKSYSAEGKGWLSSYSEKLAVGLIATGLIKRGAVEEAIAYSQDRVDDLSLCDISLELTEHGRIDEAFTIAEKIDALYFRVSALCDIAIAWKERADQNQGDSDDTIWTPEIPVIHSVADAVVAVSHELIKQGRDEELTDALPQLIGEDEKCRALVSIITAYAKENKTEEAKALCFEALNWVNRIKFKERKSEVLSEICKAFADMDATNEALTIFHEIEIGEHKYTALDAIARSFVRQGKSEEALAMIDGWSDYHDYEKSYSDLYKNLAEQGRIEDVLALAQQKEDSRDKEIVIMNAVTELAKANKEDAAFGLCSEMSEEDVRRSALASVVSELYEHGQFERALLRAKTINGETPGLLNMEIAEELVEKGAVDIVRRLIQETLPLIMALPDGQGKSGEFIRVACLLINAGSFDEAISIVRSLREGSIHEFALLRLLNIAQVQLEKGRKGEAEQLHQELFRLAINKKSVFGMEWKARVAAQLAEAGELDQAMALAHEIADTGDRRYVLAKVTHYLVKEGEIDLRDTFARDWVLQQLGFLTNASLHWRVIEQVHGRQWLGKQHWTNLLEHLSVQSDPKHANIQLKGHKSIDNLVTYINSSIEELESADKDTLEAVESLIKQFGLVWVGWLQGEVYSGMEVEFDTSYWVGQTAGTEPVDGKWHLFSLGRWEDNDWHRHFAHVGDIYACDLSFDQASYELLKEYAQPGDDEESIVMLEILLEEWRCKMTGEPYEAKCAREINEDEWKQLLARGRERRRE